MFGLSKEEIVKRSFFIFGLAKFISHNGYRFISRPHVENMGAVTKVKNQKGTILYTGLHKSLWETTGVLSCLKLNGGHPIPFSGMGDNLIRGRFFQAVAKRTGIFLVKRAKTRRDVIESAKKLKQYISYYIATGTDVAIFPEGTRRNIPEKGEYGNFFPTAFDAVLEYERNKEKILAEYPRLSPRDVYIIPYNTDYSKIREDLEYIGDIGKKPRTLHIFDSLKMIKHVGDVYISFGEPIKITDHLDKSRKELAVYTRERCLELVKILPINIVGRAATSAIEQGQGEVKTDTLLKYIAETVEKLDAYKDRFRGFEPDDSPQTILDKVTRYEKKFRNIDAACLPFYRLYANYIHHYWG
jgi:1-acyl-sn-glycerol-3-phosphate acyltransferase